MAEEELPVRRTDLLVLVAVSLVGGFLIASLTLTPQLSVHFVVSIFSGMVMLSFFLFIPVMGIRLFLEDDGETE